MSGRPAFLSAARLAQEHHMKFRFPIVIIDEDFRSENTSGLGIRALAAAIEKEGMEMLGVTSYGDLSQFAQQQSRASAFILSIDDEEFTPGPELDPAIAQPAQRSSSEIRFKNAEIPIYLYGETRTSQHIPNDILRELHGFIHMFEDTPEFVARHIIREAKSYLDSLAPPFFRALVDYAQDGSYSWHCPGHSGGVAFLKSPVGQMFHQFFGENMLRADVCNAGRRAGPAPRPLGPGCRGGAQRGADLQRRPLLLRHQRHVDVEQDGVARQRRAGRHRRRRPQLPRLDPARDHDDRRDPGVPAADAQPPRHHRPDPAGRIPAGEHPRSGSRRNPFARAAKNKKPRILTLTQSTYDGIAYNVEMLKQTLGNSIETLHFDEAWLPHAAFHEFYQRHARDRQGPPAQQGSAHLRDALDAQAAGGHLAGVADHRAGVGDAEARPPHLQRGVPDAHVDVAAVRDHRVVRRVGGDDGAARRHRAGRGVDHRGARLPPRDAQGRRRVGQGLVVQGLGPGAPRAPRASASATTGSCAPTRSWHGFGELATGFNILDPIKATIITPGLDVSGKFAKTGIPASIVTRFLAEHGVIVEKTGLYSFFIMFTIGITKGRWNTLVTALQQFKDDYDKNQPLWKILPEFVAKQPQYERVGLRDLCQQIHDMYKANDVARVTTEMYRSDMQPAMKPSDAFACMAHREIDRVEIDNLEGRVTSVLLHALSAGHSAAHSRRALQPHDRRIPEVRAQLQREVPRLRHGHPRPGRGNGPGQDAVLHGLREGVGGGRGGACSVSGAA